MSETPPQSAEDRDTLLALLAWYRANGVDAAVSARTVDWLARGDVPPKTVARPADAVRPAPAPGPPQQSRQPSQSRPPPVVEGPARAPAARAMTPTPPDAATADARTAAASAATLAELHAALAAFDGCGLKATAKNLCFFRGAEAARVMVIGEAPGRDEDRSGSPFVGRAGQLLDKMLAAIALDETQVHITNVVYWRPPGNRTPTPQEVLVCRPFLERQIELVAPDIIVTVGGPAAKAILNTAQGIMKTRGKWGEYVVGEGNGRKVMPTLHPAYLLRTPAAKRLAWRDLLAVRSALDG
ncbi:MAG: uracil-DNA glycosylase [Hyphomicrobiaceae bacterium]